MLNDLKKWLKQGTPIPDPQRYEPLFSDLKMKAGYWFES